MTYYEQALPFTINTLRLFTRPAILVLYTKRHICLTTAVSCSIRLSVVVFGCQFQCLAVSCSVWLSGAVFGCQLQCLAVSCGVWLSVAVSGVVYLNDN
jgi:hypothetical protein